MWAPLRRNAELIKPLSIYLFLWHRPIYFFTASSFESDKCKYLVQIGENIEKPGQSGQSCKNLYSALSWQQQIKKQVAPCWIQLFHCDPFSIVWKLLKFKKLNHESWTFACFRPVGIIIYIPVSVSPAMGARNQEGIEFSYRPASLCSLATQFQTRFLESILRPIAWFKFSTLGTCTVYTVHCTAECGLTRRGYK
jgi:hypothetical protein